MQQTLEHSSRYRQSRLKGALRYHLRKLGKILLWVLAGLLAAQLIGVLAALFGVGNFTSSGVAAEFGTAMLLLMVFAFMLAKGSTTFLLRFGTSRTSVWLSNLAALFVCGAAFMVGSLLLSLLMNYIVLALSAGNSAFEVARSGLFGNELIVSSLMRTLGELPTRLLWLAEWSCLFYLLACCIRRNKAVTLTVCIVVPLLVWLTLLLPVVNQAVDLIESGTEGEILLTGMQWLQWLSNAAKFLARHWQWVQGLAALISLPLSWLCMRSTPQP